MTTVAQMGVRVLAALDDAGSATWSVANIEQWVRDGMKEYSILFGEVVKISDLDIENGTYLYDLPEPTLTKSIISLEIPHRNDGADPPNYYERKSHKDPDFHGGQYYDLIGDGQLVIGDPGVGGLYGDLVYTRYYEHGSSLIEDSTLPIPAYHENLLLYYGMWMAWQFLASGEMQDPTSNSSLLMSQIVQNAHVMRRTYLQAVKIAQDAITEDSVRVSWREASDYPTEIY